MKVYIGFFLLWLASFGGECFGQSKDSLLFQQYLNDKHLFEEYEAEHRHFFQAKHVELSYLSWGKPGKDVFVWLPGSLLSAYDFQPFADFLTQAGYFVISVDHYGHGFTPIPGTDADFSDFAADLSALLKSLHVEKAVIGGFSRGGYLATSFYQEFPDQVKALVLEDGGSVGFRIPFLKMNPEQLKLFLQEVEPAENIKALYLGTYDSEFQVYANLYDRISAGSQFQNFGFIRSKGDKWISYQGLDTYMSTQNESNYRKLLFQTDSISRYARAIALLNPEEVFANLKVPMLILDAVATPDLFDVQSENKRLAQSFPDLITYHAFSCSNHNIHQACPEEFTKVLMQFIQTI